VRGRLVAVEVVEDGCERFSSVQDVGRLGAFVVHVDGEAGVVAEERLLAYGVAAIGAVGLRVEEFAQGEPVGGFRWRELGTDGHR
jgi:hypothetical protein